MGTKISAMTTTGSAPSNSYLPLAYDGKNYKIEPQNVGGGRPEYLAVPTTSAGSETTASTLDENSLVIFMGVNGLDNGLNTFSNGKKMIFNQFTDIGNEDQHLQSGRYTATTVETQNTVAGSHYTGDYYFLIWP